MPRPTVAFFGSSLLSSYKNSAATYYRGITRALHARGYNVTFYEPDDGDRRAHRDLWDPDWVRVVTYPATLERVEQALDDGCQADIVVKTSGVGVFDEVIEAQVLARRRRSSITAYWDVDAPATLERVRKNPDDHLRVLIPKYDVILTRGGCDGVVRAYEAFGARTCVPIHNAVDPTAHHPCDPDWRFEADVSFLGNWWPDREASLDDLFFGMARAMPAHRFLLGGSGWNGKPRPDNVSYIGHVYTLHHNAFNCSSRAVLNVNRDRGAPYSFSPPARLFESAGAGACVITGASDGIESFLEPGREVLPACDGSEAASIVQELRLKRAMAIGHAAMKRILAEHTYAGRVQQLETALEITSGARV